MELLETWSKLYSLRYSPVGLLHFVFGTGTIFLLLSLQSALGIRVGIQSLKRSLSQAELCVQYLRDMGKSWKAAASTADILQGLIDTKLEPIITRRGVRLDVEELNSNPVSLATDGARAEALVPPDDPVPFTPSTSWHEPLDMDAIMNELPWPQAHWDFYDDPSSSNALHEVLGPTPFAPPMLFPGADSYPSEVDMAQFLPPTRSFEDSIPDSEHWKQRIL